MAEAVISALIDQLVSVTWEQAGKTVSLVTGVDAEVESLRRNLEAIRMVLVDAERRQVNEDGVKLWLDELKEVSYDMDSVPDKWNTAILKSKFEKGEDGAESSTSNADRITKKKVWFSLLFCFHFSKPSLRVITHRLDIAEEIQSLNGKLENITKRKDMFSFRRVSSNIAEIKRPDTTSLLDVPVVYGQDTYKKILIDRIMLSGSNREDKEQLKIIPLVGMGGIGKTTLAKNVYNDDEVKAYFEGQRVWVCVSEPFEISKIAKEFTEQLSGQTQNIVGSELLMQNFRDTVEGKKFLLVLDDVWTTSYKEWEPLEQVLRSGAATGSTVVVTTRKEEVAKMIGEMHTVHLEKLSGEDCWFLLSEIAFFEKTEQERDDFKKLTKEFAQKCNGLPLAAKTLGSLLRVKRTKEWHDLLRSDTWDLENVKEDLFYPLLLSYYDLSSLERRCFLYCSIFPKSYEFDVDELIQQWIAQGYFKPRNNDQELEQIGKKCFQNLAMRSFFQDFEYDDVECTINKCKMHDIAHDFAQYLTLNEYSILSIFDTKKIFELNARHLSLIISPMVNVPTASISNKVKLHTLMVSYDSEHQVSDNSLGTYMFPHQFLDLTRLKTLILIGALMELPTNIGDLVHLRYLFVNKGFEYINVPPTIGNLFNLRTLRLYATTELPEEVGKLINLRHLHVGEDSGGKQTWPKSIRMLTSLQNLSRTSVGPNIQKFPLRDFRNLNSLRDISLTDLGTEEHVEEAKEAQLHKKTALVRLYLDFDSPNTNMEMETHESLLENLQPPVNLLSLGIHSYKGRSISPSWMMSLINLKKLILGGCRNNDTLPPLGKLPCLESLTIFDSDGLKKMGPEFFGVEVDNGGSESKFTSATLFPKLKLLNIQDAESLCEWVGVPGWKMNGPLKIMPRLESLYLSDCFKLESLPDFLESTPLKNLKIIRCQILQESCQVEMGKDWHKIRHVPNIRIMRLE